MRIGKFAALWAASLMPACGGDASGTGALTVQLSAEATITDGLEKGDGENARDFAVKFTKYLATIGHVSVGRGSDVRRDDRVFVADMMKVGEQGVNLFTLPGLTSGRWEQFGYETPVATAGATAVAGVSAADLQTMIDRKLTYWIEGTVQADRPVRFVFQVGAPARFANCQTDARPGVAVPDDGNGSVLLTLHGDHLFFDGFLTGDESALTRRAKWIVDADLERDGLVTTEDLARPLPQLATEALFPSSAGYRLIPGVNDALDFVRMQLMTQGHVNGEGECTWEPL